MTRQSQGAPQEVKRTISEDADDQRRERNESSDSSGNLSAVKNLYINTQSFDVETQNEEIESCEDMLAKINGDLRCYVSSAKAKLQGQNCELKALLREASSNSSDFEAMLEQGQEKTANLEAELKCSKDEVNRIKSELQNSKGLLDAANKRLRDNGDYIEGLLEGRNSIVLKFTHETSALKGDNAKLHARLLEEKEKRELVEDELNRLKARINALCQDMNGEL